MPTSDPDPLDHESDPPAQPNATPAKAGAARIPDQAELEATQASANFLELKRRFRHFAFPMTAAFLIWYFFYVLVSVYAADLMATPVFGNLNLGLLLGLAQFVTTFLITFLYIRFANKRIDPPAARIREQLEGGALL